MDQSHQKDLSVLQEYTFALCSPGTWPFPSTMDLNILPKVCLAYDTPADSENVPEDPGITEPDNNVGSGKKHRKHRGKSKAQSKSARATSSASETSPGGKNWKPWINEALAKQVAQDLHLSSDGSNSKNPEETHTNTPADEDLQPLANVTRTESGANPPRTPAHPDLTAPAPQPNDDLGKGENGIPDQEDERDLDLTLTQPVTLVTKLGIPDPAEGAQPWPAAMPTMSTVPGGDTSSNLVPSWSNTPPGFPACAVTPNPNATLPVSPGIALGQPSI